MNRCRLNMAERTDIPNDVFGKNIGPRYSQQHLNEVPAQVSICQRLPHGRRDDADHHVPDHAGRE